MHERTVAEDRHGAFDDVKLAETAQRLPPGLANQTIDVIGLRREWSAWRVQPYRR